MIRKSKKTEEEVEQPQAEKKSSVEKRKKAVAQKKISRFAGLIFLVITVLLGFLFWVSGEVGNRPIVGEEGVKGEPSSQSDLIIIE